MKTKTILGICLSLCVWSFAGCGDDETIDIFPEGTASLRMMNEDNGKTLLGNSDVYITNAGNFKTCSTWVKNAVSVTLTFPALPIWRRRWLYSPATAMSFALLMMSAPSLPGNKPFAKMRIFTACSSIPGLRTRTAKRLEPTSISCLANRRQTKEFPSGTVKSNGNMIRRKRIPSN